MTRWPCRIAVYFQCRSLVPCYGRRRVSI